MIRQGPIDRKSIEALVDSHVTGWRAKAAERTAAIKASGKYVKEVPIWGNVKLVFMRLQSFKCAFCERPLAREFAGVIEHDVEHFRPKGPVKAWPPAAERKAFDYSFGTGKASDSGYHWLAYDIENYAAACKPCNTIRKANYFPIEGDRGQPNSDIRSLNESEHPLLIFPIGLLDDDPSDLIAFEGIIAKPRYRSGRKYRRAIVTIDFFALNRREELWEDRFRTIKAVYSALELVNIGKTKAARAAAKRALDDALSDAGPQAGCARDFASMMKSDPKKAFEIYQISENFLKPRALSSVSVQDHVAS